MYYILFSMTGATSAAIAETSPTDMVDGTKVSGRRSACVFTTADKAEVYRKANLDSSYKIRPLTYQEALVMLDEAKVFGFTDISLDPGSVIVGLQPIENFVASMPFREMKKQKANEKPKRF